MTTHDKSRKSFREDVVSLSGFLTEKIVPKTEQ